MEPGAGDPFWNDLLLFLLLFGDSSCEHFGAAQKEKGGLQLAMEKDGSASFFAEELFLLLPLSLSLFLAFPRGGVLKKFSFFGMAAEVKELVVLGSGTTMVGGRTASTVLLLGDGGGDLLLLLPWVRPQPPPPDLHLVAARDGGDVLLVGRAEDD